MKLIHERENNSDEKEKCTMPENKEFHKCYENLDDDGVCSVCGTKVKKASPSRKYGYVPEDYLPHEHHYITEETVDCCGSCRYERSQPCTGDACPYSNECTDLVFGVSHPVSFIRCIICGEGHWEDF